MIVYFHFFLLYYLRNKYGCFVLFLKKRLESRELKFKLNIHTKYCDLGFCCERLVDVMFLLTV